MKKVKIIGKDNVGWSVDKDNKNQDKLYANCTHKIPT
jgi:hypothetical protein